MGIPDTSLLDLIVKVRSWLHLGGASDLQCFSGEFEMPNNSSSNMCCDCHSNFTNLCHRYHCQSCGRWFCGNCILGSESLVATKSNGGLGSESVVKCCKSCSEIRDRKEVGRKYSEKVHPSASPRGSPEPPSPCFNGERIKCPAGNESIQSDHFSRYLDARDYGYSLHALTSRSVTSFSAHPSPVSVRRRSSSRSDEEEAEDSGKHFFSLTSEYCHDNSDIDSISFSARHEDFNSQSVGSSPYDSPSRNDFTSYRGLSVHKKESPVSRCDGHFAQEPVLKRPELNSEDPDNTDDCSDDLSTFRNQYERKQRPLDFEHNGLLWYPPPPEDENDEAEDGFFSYDDDDDDIGESGALFSSSGSLSSLFPAKEKQNEGNKEPLRAVVQGHFRALVSQLLQGEGIKIGQENGVENWLDIVTTIAWQAANFVKPDTSKGGSMDPGDYVKVKCVASGNPSDSTLVKGVVCTKNIKHKRMTSQYKNPRLLILGGALEYQRVPNQLASFDTLLQQENDHLKMIISKIEALRPNVLLVEKSVSSYAQEHLLTKEISLVLNVKKPLLECIARCTGALITPSIDNFSTARLGHCELFHLEKVYEEHESTNQFNKKPSKTLMFFEGCPRRLGCTVLLKGTNREELKKVKNVIQYAVFAAYHLSLETSFLADEGATLPKMVQGQSIAVQEKATAAPAISVSTDLIASTNSEAVPEGSAHHPENVGLNPELGRCEPFSGHFSPGHGFPTSTDPVEGVVGNVLSDACDNDLASNITLDSSLDQSHERKDSNALSDIGSLSQPESQVIFSQDERQHEEVYELTRSERVDENEASSEYFSAADTHQSILVSFSSHCVLKGTVCERSRLMRIKFYGCFDKPLGRYLRDDLFDQTSCCRSCKEPGEAHVLCYTHQQGNLTINVRRLPALKLPGERDGKIWMWHRCLRCALIDGVPPATRRVVMSDAAWGLSFGKFLELSFSNHATANRIASCGHSLQKDCLRYYGFGNMVVFFRYSPIDILSVHLPPSMLEFNGDVQPEWLRKEATQLMRKMETLYAEISDVLDVMEDKSKSFGHELSDTSELLNHIMELKDLVKKERNDYIAMLQPAIMEISQPDQMSVDALELNRLRRSLLIGSHVWDRRFYSLDSLLKRNSLSRFSQGDLSFAQPLELKSDSSCKDDIDHGNDGNVSESLKLPDSLENDPLSDHREPNIPPCEPCAPEDSKLISCHHSGQEETHTDGEIAKNVALSENTPSDETTLSERIDFAWTGTDPLPVKAQFCVDGLQNGPIRQASQSDNPPFRRLALPARVHSFDSALRVQERIRKGLPPSLHVSTLRSFHASGDYRNMIRDPVSSVMRTYSQVLPQEAQKLNLILSSTPSFISSASHVAEGVRMLLPQTSQEDIVVAVYDNEPTSVISYALSSKEYDDWVADKSNEQEVGWSTHESNKEDSAASTFSAWQSFGSMDLDYICYGSGTEDVPSSMSSLFTDTKKSPHLRLSFGDDKVKFSVTCYFAELFDSLRKKCCPSEVDFLRSLSRCKRWSAQGGKSNVYFAKSLDDRFIVKQVTKTELESFEEFAPEYFKYLTHSLNSGSPTCLAKILGIYQVTTKHLKGGKETKMDLMVMENLFFKRRISRIYDLKGSARSRYNPDTTGANKVLLDMNLLETLRTKPIFLGSKAKRSLERAIWNDTAFLASVDVMDYSLLVGVDDERKELVLGIIDFMRQYTWDKHLETWVKASGILGGPKNESPTIISPIQYKKRFRKAMTTYFLTVPDQWSS
ncbi:1-phosphatidylinositol-3-phosphate 5-kinase [Morus notabilis]|uniref:1-phosphatidylinositol-3-phosphate 5-kinase n=1 Tax=Morus notabilis TaxID=981085 RepID=W9S0D4_9ROSA|nr:putative 1-phosphatidylinositol-3-phosphate 5-kinase FAB1C isoform X2 [Morus notabilis]EXC06051.1 1-phosphatidylinositol-3-phosphate 5-kinase [Morus notabilis]